MSVTSIKCRRRRSGCQIQHGVLSLILMVLEVTHLVSAFHSDAVRVNVAAEYQRARGGSGPVRRARDTRNTWMASALTATPRTKAEKKDEFFRSKDRMVEFGSSQHMEASMPGATLRSMQDYVSDPSRIIYACWDPDDIEHMGEGIFRMRFQGQRFLSVSLDFHVDIEVRLESDGKVYCKSIGHSMENMAGLLGQDFVKSFSLELEGKLSVEEVEAKVRALNLKNTILVGDVEVTIGGKLPPLIAATPEPLVRAAALGMNQRVLEYISSAFVSTIARDYRQWERAQKTTP